MLKRLKKNYFLFLSTFLILYFFFNFLSGERGFISYFEKKQILNDLKQEEIKIPYTTVPHRVPGRMFCLPHKDEGLVKVGGVDKWAKGETTARNEKRFVHQMQQGKWDYKSDGIKQLKYNLVGVEEITPKAKFINITL